MKKISGFFILMLMALGLFGQDADKVVGVWLTQYEDSKVTITKDADGKFNGEISWLNEPLKNGKPKVDEQNPDKTIRSREMLGLRILEGFEYNLKNGEWINGTIYDPKNGKTYKCLMWFGDDPDKLSVKGYIGFSFIGREVIWTRSQ